MLIFAAILAIFVYGMIAAMLGTILPELSERFHLTPAQNGTIAFSQALGLIIASLGVGPLLDTQGDKIGLILGLAFIVVALSPCRGPWLPQYRLSAVPARHRRRHRGHRRQCAGQRRQRDHRATALNLLNLFFGLGGLATPFISANLFKRNWVRLCYTVASLTVIALVIQAVTQMPAPTAAASFVLADAGPVLGRPLLFMLGALPFSLCLLRSRRLELAPTPSHRPGHPRIPSPQHPLARVRPRPARWPRRRLAHPGVTFRHPGPAGASIAMAVTTFLMLRTEKPAAAGALVFIAGLAMAPVFPTTLAITGTAFPRMTGTAIGFVITCGWAGLAVSSRIIGAIAGGDPLAPQESITPDPSFGRPHDRIKPSDLVER